MTDFLAHARTRKSVSETRRTRGNLANGQPEKVLDHFFHPNDEQPPVFTIIATEALIWKSSAGKLLRHDANDHGAGQEP